MDDDKKNPDENQPRPIFESVPEEELKPEEVAPEIVAATGEEVKPVSSEIPPEMPPVVYEESRTKYFIIGGGVIFFLVILFFLLRLLFRAGPSKEVKLIYWGLWEEKEIIAPILEEYQRKNQNVKIDYQKMVSTQYREKLLARSKNGQGPDIFRFHNTWLPEIKDVVSALPQKIMSNSEFEKTFYPIHQKDLKIGESYYGIPLYIDGLVLIYNDGLFKKAGIVSPPSTWDDLTDAVTKLTVKNTDGQLVTSGIALGLASNVDHFSDILGLMLLQNGADLKSLNQPEAAGALESFRKFAEPPNNFWDETMPNSVSSFIQEKVAMIFVPSWEILVIKNANPDLQLKVAPVPNVPEAAQISIANYWAEGVSRYSKNQIEAWKLVRYLVEKDVLTKLYENEAKVRLFGEPYSRVDLGSLLSQNEYVGAVIKQANSYTSLPVISRTFDNGLNDEIIQYLENAVNATVEGISYSDALNTASHGVSQIFEKYKIQ
ncbi:extracellular solute-binding protein [Candidatus Roizmanbacteria bacterium]|nr:extracellular solute-binding protein [Candidatus Roizmanbacteria bacterium]